MTTSDMFVIVGAGLAGAKTAGALRKKGFGGRVLGRTHPPCTASSRHFRTSTTITAPKSGS